MHRNSFIFVGTVYSAMKESSSVLDELLKFMPSLFSSSVREKGQVFVITGIVLASLFFANVLAFLSKRVAERRRNVKAEKLKERRGENVAITLITGFLGVGKTTLLNHILKCGPDEFNTRFMVLVNEFGKLGVDHMLVKDVGVVSQKDVIMLQNGCMCCKINPSEGEMERIFDTLLSLPEEYGRVLIETTGLADPQPILAALERARLGGSKFYVESVVTVVDSTSSSLNSQRVEDGGRQLAFADVVVLSKTDKLCDEDALKALERDCLDRNPFAKICRARHGKVDSLRLIMGQRLFESDRFERTQIKFQGTQSHKSRIASLNIESYTFERAALVKMSQLQSFLKRLELLYGQDILRIKGLLCIDHSGTQFIVNGIGNDVAGHVARKGWDTSSIPQSFIVVIGKRIRRHVGKLEKAFDDACYDG